MTAITEFKGDYRWLSNFWLAAVTLRDADGIVLQYPSVEHAYQACKADDPAWHEWVRTASSPFQAKKRGRQIRARFDWELIKRKVMFDLVWRKFEMHEDLALKLQATNGPLVEGNTWGDTFWGATQTPSMDLGIWYGEDGTAWYGHNYLGKILMMIRELRRPV